MDKDMQQGHEPEHVDLIQIEDAAGARVDPLFERQIDDTEIMGPGFGARFSSDTPVRSPAGTATALLKVVVAAGLPAAGLAAGGWAMRVATWLTLTLAVVIFLVVGAVGLVLILRASPIPRAPRETNFDNDEEANGDTDRETPCDQTDPQHNRRVITHPAPARTPRTLQPPRRR
jgi:hypothetical protein